MKTCPECRRNYPDEYSYCLDDGSPLSDPVGGEPTAIFKGPYSKTSGVTEQMPPQTAADAAPTEAFFLPTTENDGPKTYSIDQPSRSSRTLLWVAAAVLLTSFTAGVIYMLALRPPGTTNARLAANSDGSQAPIQSETPASTPAVNDNATAENANVPTPTPTPDVDGKYTGPTGDVTISNVTDKTFSFKISVGSTNGVGHIDGNASRTTPSVAVYSKIPDPKEFNDPESIYYKKKCRITFRFVGGKLKVSEDDYACSYWHGAQIDFNGTFSAAKKK